MRISQLAAESGVPVPTIKYYLREGLLPAGELTAATQASYDESHVRRLRLIRSLITHAGLSVAATRQLLATLDDPPAHAHDLLGAAAQAVATEVDPDPDARDRMHRLLTAAGWDLEGIYPGTIDTAAIAFQHLSEADFPLPEPLVRAYLDAARTLARAEIENVPTDSAEAAVRYVTVGVVLAEPLLLALRRLAEEVESLRRFGARGLD